MKKFSKIGKRVLAFFLVALMNINSYAAVGANDGSAFVTKAEFDAFVNTFNEQMDTYEGSLITKVDGAIANYLAGLSSERIINQENIYDVACKYNKNQVKFRFMKAGFEPENTNLPTRCVIGGEYYYKNNDKLISILFKYNNWYRIQS